MSATVIGIRRCDRGVIHSVGTVQPVRDYQEVYKEDLIIGIRRDMNIRYMKRCDIPFDVDLDIEVSKATDKVLKIFRDTFKEFEGKSTKIAVLLPVILTKVSTICEAADGVKQMREGFMTLIETATAITEPILWFYALAACIMMATGKKGVGWEKLKNVGYSYILITMLPTLFEFCRWISKILMTCIG